MNRIFICLGVGLLFSLAGKAQFKKHDNIKFDFRVEGWPATSHNLKISGTLYNPNKDTVYFLTTSCNGIEDCLRYDSTAFLMESIISCNASWPIVAKIPPNGKLDFIASLKVLGNANTVKLGFNLYEVESSFDPDNPKLSLADVYKLNRKHKNIFWAEGRRFE